MALSVDWEVPAERWRDLAARSAGATFFHLPGWYQTHAELGDHVVQALHFRWEDGREALLPMALKSRFRGWIREAISGLENGYGGLLSPLPLPPHRIEEAYAQVRARYPNLRVLGNPLSKHLNVPLSGQRLESFTQAVEILPAEAQRARMSEMRRRHLRKAEKAGFTLERIHPVLPSAARDLYAVYQEHSARWKYRRWVRDDAYFRALFRHAGEDLVLFQARHDGELAGFILLGCWGETVVELHLATRPAFEALQVGTYLIAKPLEWAYEAGYRVFDFLPSGSLAGIVAYKETFGSERLRQVEVLQESFWSRGLASMRGRLRPERLASSHG